MDCQYCSESCVKNGKQKDGTQKYRCKSCGKWQQKSYKYQAKIMEKRRLIVRFLTRNCGFRGLASGLKISVNTVMKTIHDAAEKLKEPVVPKGSVFEVDEIKAYGKKGKSEIWEFMVLKGKVKRYWE